MKLAIVGCTGLVGTVILNVLNENSVPFSELILVASSKSIGKINYNGQDYNIVSIEDALAKKPELAIFSAEGLFQNNGLPFAKNGTTVIDNSPHGE